MFIINHILSLGDEPVPPILQKYLFGKPDPRISKWTFFKSPLPSICILFFYFALIAIGPKLMSNRKPFHLNSVLIVYNSLQIIMSSYIVKEIFASAYLSDYNILCQSLDTSLDPLALRMVGAFWWVYVSKLIDLMDTVFFVLRKKDSQMTFLHIYHHSSMVINWYLGAIYLPGGQAFLSCLLNGIVHVLMYSYYLMSAMGPNMKPFLWWKCYLTQIQLLQFIVVMLHIMLGASISCAAPGWLTMWSVSYIASLVVLFLNFYRKTYHKMERSKVFKLKCFDLGCMPNEDSDAIADDVVKKSI